MFCYDDTPVPFTFIADDAFLLTDRCLKPYSRRSLGDIKRIFGYRLSRFRRVSENGFGIWSSRFRLFLGRANFLPEMAADAAVASSYMPPDTFDKEIEDNTVMPGS